MPQEEPTSKGVLNVALDELEAHAQEGSLKTIVLFSDGETLRR